MDLSTRRGVMAMRNEGIIIASRAWENDRRSSSPFFEALHEITRQHGPADIIGVGVGPGSYTGTRIAIASAFGLHAVTGAKLRAWPSVAAISTESRYQVIGDAKRNSFFLAQVSNGSLSGNPSLLAEEEMRQRISPTNVPTYTSDDLPGFAHVEVRFPSAELLCELIEKHADTQTSLPLTPIYLREPHITSPRRQR